MENSVLAASLDKPREAATTDAEMEILRKRRSELARSGAPDATWTCIASRKLARLHDGARDNFHYNQTHASANV